MASKCYPASVHAEMKWSDKDLAQVASQLSQTPLPIAKITIKLEMIRSPAMTATSTMLPLLAGNLPRIT